LTQKVEEFFIESKEAEEEVARWKEACELEVKAGKKEIEERDKMVNTFFTITAYPLNSLFIVISY
jgi:hypothetical protein